MIANTEKATTYNSTDQTGGKDFKHGLDGLADDMQHAANSAGTAVRDMADKVVEETSHATHDVISFVRTNPMQSSMLALGAGFVIGALLRR